MSPIEISENSTDLFGYNLTLHCLFKVEKNHLAVFQVNDIDNYIIVKVNKYIKGHKDYGGDNLKVGHVYKFVRFDKNNLSKGRFIRKD